MLSNDDPRTLTEALAAHGIVHTPGDDRGRHLWRGNEYLGRFDVVEGWRLIHNLERRS